MLLVLALFAAAQGPGLTNGGFHDDGVGPDGNHYFEMYWYSTDQSQDCDPYGPIQVSLGFAQKIVNNQWVNTNDVFQSYAGVSGFSHHECQVNVYATNGAGQRALYMQWSINGTVQSGNPNQVHTF